MITNDYRKKNIAERTPIDEKGDGFHHRVVILLI